MGVNRRYRRSWPATGFCDGIMTCPAHCWPRFASRVERRRHSGADRALSPTVTLMHFPNRRKMPCASASGQRQS